VIEVEGLRFTYPRAAEPAVRGLDFRVARGEIFGFLGPNGAGKSTTQKILIGLLTEFEGRVQVMAQPHPPRSPDFYERIGVAFEFPNHYLKLTGLENLSYFRALYQGATAEPTGLLEQVDLSDAADMPVSQYSKGMKTRLSIARALLNDPEILFLDEPTTGLDPVSARRIKALIRAQRDAGRTVFLTTHDMVVADELCDRVAFIVAGEIALIDTPRALKLQHGTRRVRVEVLEDGRTFATEFALDGLGADPAFLAVIGHPHLQTIHTLEAPLEDVFVDVTGQKLG
jgi:fluoroquinolone transport system ATP-binding protein